MDEGIDRHDSEPSGLTASIIVPCYNEASRFAVDDFVEFVARRPWLTFVLVDDGSTDGTGSVIAAAAERAPGRIDTLALEENSGKAEAVRQGILRALQEGPELIGYWDADLATPLAEIDVFRERFSARPELEIAIGSRVKLLGRRIDRSALRHYFGRVAATAVSMILRLAVYDTQCGAKMFRSTPRVREIFAAPFLTRWIFDVEILARWLVRLGPQADPGVSAIEIPVERWTDVAESKLRTRDFVRSPVDLWRIHRHYGRALRKLR